MKTTIFINTASDHQSAYVAAAKRMYPEATIELEVRAANKPVRVECEDEFGENYAAADEIASFLRDVANN